MSPLAAGGLSAALALLYVPLARRWIGVVDAQQTDRSGRPMPRGGGVALLAAWAVPVLWVLRLEAVPLVAMAGAATAIGLHDDLRRSSARLRALALGGLALAASWWVGGLAAVALPGLGVVPMGALAVPAGAAVVLATNVGFDFADGLDGLAAGLCLIACVGLLWAGAGVEVACLAGASAAFLVFNRPPASVYLGDSGSNLVGFLLGVALLRSARLESGAFALLPALLLVAVPAADTGSALLRRARGGEGLFAGDREHIHHRLGRRFGPAGALLVLLAVASAGTGIAAWLLVL